MPITKPIYSEIAHNVWCINEFGMDSQFLVVGSERALLIDTGTGCYNIPKLVKEITDKPFDVALTHGHVDHAGGIGLFDKVYCNKADFEMAKNISAQTRIGYKNRMMGFANGIFDVKDDEVLRFEKMPELIHIGEGYVFDLGEQTVKVFETPGHTPGGLSFLIEKERIILTGDACNMNTLLFNSSIETLLNTAIRIDELQPLYDRNYNGHVGFGPILNCIPMPDSLTKDMIKLCRGVMDGTVKYEITEGDFVKRCAIASCDTCRIQFDPNNIND